MQNLLEKLRANGFAAHFAADKKAALEIAKKELENVASVGFGGSESVKEIGLFDYAINAAKDGKFTLFNQYEAGISMEENARRRQQGMLAEAYLTSTNALTRAGWLVNADGSGNRVAAMIYSGGKVVLVVGRNKIVQTLDEAIVRILQVAAPRNIERLNAASAAHGKARAWTLENIARKFSVIRSDGESFKGAPRVAVILVDEDLGY